MLVVWIVDDGPLDTLSRVVAPAEAAKWPKHALRVADATAKEARGGREALLQGPDSPFETFSVMVDTPAWNILYDHLREETSADKNLAEHESIAWALAEWPEAVFVARDKRAAFLALAELGRGGAAHPSELWLHLFDRQLVTAAQFKELCETTAKSEQSSIPLRCPKLI